MMTAREVFDKVAKHLLDQGKKSLVISGRMCAYRGDNGLTCAVGCLIPDDIYDPKMEGKSIYALIDNYSTLRKLLGNHRLLLVRLQRLHDSSNPKNWEDQLDDMREKL